MLNSFLVLNSLLLLGTHKGWYLSLSSLLLSTLSSVCEQPLRQPWGGASWILSQENLGLVCKAGVHSSGSPLCVLPLPCHTLVLAICA